MQVPILSGIYTNEQSEFRTAYPKNMIPVPKPTGLSNGYLRPGEGMIQDATATGLPRGGINWNDICYRVSGSDLIRVAADGTVTNIGSVGGTGQTTLDYSFDYLGVLSGTNFYLYDGTTLTQVTDPDLGAVIDFVWVDGYFFLTDGTNLIVTELSNPFSVEPAKYGSSEADPDPVKAILKVRNEPHVLNRYTIEVFDNVGGSGFPFQRIDGAQIQRGVVGTHACAVFMEAVAFVGGGRGESIGVYMGGSGSSVKISTREIDELLSSVTEAVLSDVVVESRTDKGHQFLYVHLPDRTLVYDGAASAVSGEAIWFVLSSALQGHSKYRAKDFVWCYDKWLVADSTTTNLGYVTNTLASHWGDEIEWDITTDIMYNEGRGAILHEIELVGLSGRAALGVEPTIYTRYSPDGESWSTVRGISAGKTGQRQRRLVWLNQGPIKNWRIQQFRGTSEAMLTVSRLEIRAEPLAV